jgi:hypothetical protein
MYFSIQADRQEDSLREREEDGAEGMQWLKQFLWYGLAGRFGERSERAY